MLKNDKISSIKCTLTHSTKHRGITVIIEAVSLLQSTICIYMYMNNLNCLVMSVV